MGATALVVGFLGLEFNLRVFGGPIQIFNPLNGFHEGDPVLGWRGKRNFERRFKTADFDVVVRHDEDGFRQPDPPRPEEASRNLLVLGDSLAWGWGVAQGELFTDVLQRRLGTGVAVFNRAVNAYSTGQEYLLLQRELENRDYADVLIVVSATDMGDNADDKKHRPAFDLVGTNLVPRNQPPPGVLKNVVERFLDDHSHATNFLSWQLAALKRWWQRSTKPRGNETSPAPDTGANDDSPVGKTARAAPPNRNGAAGEPGFAVTERLLAEVVDTCRRHGCRVHFAYATTNLHLRHSAFENGFRDLVREIAHREGASFLDLNEPLEEMWSRNEVPLIPHDGHWSRTGHEAVAEQFLRAGAFR